MTAILCDRFEHPEDPSAVARAWCDHLAPIFTTTLSPTADLSAPLAMTTWHMGDVILGETVAPAQRLERNERMIARQGLDHVLLHFHESGTARVETGRRSVLVEPHQVLVLDLSQPVVIQAGPVTTTQFLIPRRLLSDEIGLIEALHGQAFDYQGDPVKRLFHAYLRGLITCGDRLEPHQLPGISQAASKLCAACFPATTGSQRLPADAETNLAIRQYIHHELASPHLSIDTITARFGLSRATLYRLFEPDGGVIKYIRDRRLLRAMRLLTQSGSASRPRVSTVAYATGFADEKTFSRAFKRRFGFVPREADPGDLLRPKINDNASVLLTWIKSLAA